MAYLEIKLAGGQNHKLMLRDGDNIIGNGAAATIHLGDPLVAAEQLSIQWQGDRFVLRNLAPDRPCFLNGAPLTGEGELQSGDQLILGSTRCRFYPVDLDSTREMLEMSQSQPESAVNPLDLLEITAAQKLPAGLTGDVPAPPAEEPVTEADLRCYPYLEITDPAGRSRLFPLREKETLAGNIPESSLRLADPAVAARHAKFILRAEGAFLVDMGSGAGVYLNERIIVREPLREGDHIRLGRTRLVFHEPRRPEPEPPPPPPVKEAAPPPPAPIPVPAAPAARSRRAWLLPAILLGVLLVLAAAGWGAYSLWTLRSRPPLPPVPPPPPARQVVEQLLKQRQWAKALEVLDPAGSLDLPAAQREEFTRQARAEQEAAEFVRQTEGALANDSLDTALELYFRIPAGSVYRATTGDAIIRFVERKIDALLRPAEMTPAACGEIATLSEKMLQVTPGYLPALTNIFLARLSQNDLPAALETANTMVTAQPAAADGHFFRALVLYRTGQPAAALDSVNEAIRLDDGHAEAYLLRAKVEILLGRADSAGTDLDRSLALDPRNETARALYQRLKGREPVQASLPGRSDTRQYQDLLRARNQVSVAAREETAALERFCQGDPAGAGQQLTELARRHPGSKDIPRWNTLRANLDRIQQLYQEGRRLAATDYPAALAKWEEMRTLESTALAGRRSSFTSEAAPEAAEFLAQRAAADLQQDLPDRAYALAARALLWQPGHAAAAGIIRRVEDTAGQLYLAGFRQYQQGDPAGARQYWEKVLRTVPVASPWHGKAKEKLDSLEFSEK